MNSPTTPTIDQTSDGYTVQWEAEGIGVEIERIVAHKDDLTVEATVRSTRQPRPGLLKWGRLNLMAESTRKQWSTALADREPDLDWAGMLDQLARRVALRYREGDPAIDLRQVTPGSVTRWLVEPFIERGGPTLLFAAGGTGKSLLALGIACSYASGRKIVGTPRVDPRPVLYLDWETDGPTVAERLRAISWGAELPTLPEIHYRRQVASLESAAQEIRREIERLGIGMVIVDSLGAARGGEPESADFTIRAFNAARSLGTAVLIVDHVTKAQGNDSKMAFGSVYSTNLSRLTWSLDRSEDSDVLALINRKRNNGRLLPRMGLRLDIQSSPEDEMLSARFETCDLLGVADLERHEPLARRIQHTLRNGPLTREEITGALDANLYQVRSRITELLRSGKIIRMTDDRLALPARGELIELLPAAGEDGP